METTERVPCPYCCELILPDAVKCKECGSSLKGAKTPRPETPGWHRDQPDRKVLGVAACVGRNLHVSPTLVRLGFVVATFFGAAGIIVYLALAAILPGEAGQRSLFDRFVDAIGAAAQSFRTTAAPKTATAGAAPATPMPEAPVPTDAVPPCDQPQNQA
ncbi:MAG: PspC domain-containing protein [Candidatus Sumerlaeaceae bacterium]|nr:PspC domain-containing protein [Candidatus Sumerlaeaceae bacterium]